MEVLRNLNNWKVYNYESLLSSLFSVLLDESSDQSIWTLNPNGSFSVELFYKFLVKNNSLEDKLHSSRYRK